MRPAETQADLNLELGYLSSLVSSTLLIGWLSFRAFKWQDKRGNTLRFLPAGVGKTLPVLHPFGFVSYFLRNQKSVPMLQITHGV